NLNYWHFGDYLGIGAGAHGKLSDAARQRIVRTAKTRHPDRYMQSAAGDARISTITELSPDDAVLEYAMNALRLAAGFTRDEFTAATGLGASLLDRPLAAAIRDGLMVEQDERLHATTRGRRYLNTLLQYWMPEDRADAGTH
ncbi:MAG: hypothetical protein R3308_08400, partial [Thiohalobacterales bacterium]|nr:hypothetical protein [Thiohalobacterales bacterium]